MIIVRLMGGVGNQMFQYAFGRFLAEKNHTELKIDTTLLLDHSGVHEIVTHRNLNLNIFNVQLDFASPTEIIGFNGKKYKNPIGKTYNKALSLFRKKNLIIENGRQFHPELLNLKDNKCLVGSWQSEKYFKEIEPLIKQEFTFKTELNLKEKELANSIKTSNSLCVHVRRGDYITSPIYNKTLGALPLEYYKEGIDIIKSKQAIDQIFIFSDDIKWCQENFSIIDNSYVVGAKYGGDKISTSLHLMSHCKHFIISNSTFGWWGAWLGSYKEKIVVAPKKWYKDQNLDSSDIIPPEWIKI